MQVRRSPFPDFSFPSVSCAARRPGEQQRLVEYTTELCKKTSTVNSFYMLGGLLTNTLGLTTPVLLNRNISTTQACQSRRSVYTLLQNPARCIKRRRGTIIGVSCIELPFPIKNSNYLCARKIILNSNSNPSEARKVISILHNKRN